MTEPEVPEWVIADACKSAYSPGGWGKCRRKEVARYNGAKGGRACGRRRRQLAKGKRRTRDGGLGVPRVYPPVPWLSAEQFEQRFRQQCEQEGRRFHQGGYDTARAVYTVLKRWQEAKGQGFELTNENVSRALRALGRPYSRRTVQYTRQRLERMGVLTCAHVKRSGPRRIRGQMDTIRVHFLRRSLKDCTPPLRGTTKRDFVPELGGGAAQKQEERRPSTALIPPTSSADDMAAVAAQDSTGRGEGQPPAPRQRPQDRPVQMWAAGRPSEQPTPLAAFTTDRLRQAQQLALELGSLPAIADLAERRRLRRG